MTDSQTFTKIDTYIPQYTSKKKKLNTCFKIHILNQLDKCSATGYSTIIVQCTTLDAPWFHSIIIAQLQICKNM